MADSSKTEKATPKKRQDERKKGHVMMSQDVVSVTTLLVSAAILFAMGGMIVHGMELVMHTALGDVGASWRDFPLIFQDVKRLSFRVLLQALILPLASCAAAIAVTFYQTKMLVTREPIKPKFSKINPLQGFKRLFSLKSLMDTLKNLLKILLLLIIVYLGVKGLFLESSAYLYTDIPVSAAHIVEAGKSL